MQHNFCYYGGVSKKASTGFAIEFKVSDGRRVEIKVAIFAEEDKIGVAEDKVVFFEMTRRH